MRETRVELGMQSSLSDHLHVRGDGAAHCGTTAGHRQVDDLSAPFGNCPAGAGVRTAPGLTGFETGADQGERGAEDLGARPQGGGPHQLNKPRDTSSITNRHLAASSVRAKSDRTGADFNVVPDLDDGATASRLDDSSREYGDPIADYYRSPVEPNNRAPTMNDPSASDCHIPQAILCRSAHAILLLFDPR